MREVRRCLQDPFAWTPLILKASDSEKLGTRIRERAEQEAKMMEADPLNIGLQDWWLTKTVTKCTEFDVELPRAPHAAYGDFLSAASRGIDNLLWLDRVCEGRLGTPLEQRW